jgi:glycosyltransferase involved in cell wall biosynthesis
VSAASLKQLSGTIPRSPDFLSTHRVSSSSESGEPIDTLIVSDKPSWPSHIYRVKNPVDALNARGHHALWVDTQHLIDTPKLFDRAIRVIAHRLEWGAPFEKLLQACRERGIPVGYDIDDLLFLPKLIADGARDSVSRLGPHEVRRWIRRSEEYQRCVREADYFVGATRPLTHAAKAFNQECHFIQNGFSPENRLMADLARRKRQPGDGRRINLGYASGTATHRADFDAVAGTLWQLMLENPNLVLTVIGPLEWDTKPPAELERRISTRPLVPHVNLPFELASFDINLAPLERNAFCDAKSPLKFFEAGLVGVPTIATNNPTYQRLGGEDGGCLTAGDSNAWRDHILDLSSDQACREALGERARRRALECFNSDLSVDSYQELPRKC